MKRYIVLAAILGLFSCDTGGPGGNRAPSVNIVSYSDSIIIGGSSVINATASDPDGDTLSYSWYVGGVLAAGGGGSSFGFLGESIGYFPIKVEVSDGQAADSDQVEVFVDTNRYIETETTYAFGSSVTCVDVSGALIAIGTSASGFSYSTDSGSNWTALTVADGLSSNVIVDIAIGGDLIYIACFQGIYIYDTSPAGFVASPASADIDANALALTAEDIFAATDSGLCVTLISDPSAWTTYDSLTDGFGLEDEVSSICIDGTTVYLGSIDSIIITDTDRSDFTSYSVSLPNSVPDTPIEAIWGSGLNIVVSDNFSFSYSSDNGTNWTDAASYIGGAITSICFDGTALYAAKYGGPLMISENNGASWYSVDFPAGIGGAFGPNGRDLKIIGTSVYLAHADGLFVGTLAEY
jgi:hypothetical protein